MSNIQYNLDNLRNVPLPLYHRYPDREKPQPAYVEMDNSGTVTANWVEGSLPMLHLGSFRWEVSPYADGESLAALLESPRMQSLFSQLREGARIVSFSYSGDSPFVTLDPFAISAESEIRSTLENKFLFYSRKEILDTDDWVDSRFSAEDLANSKDFGSYVRRLREEMEDIMEERKQVIFSGNTEESVMNLCLNHLSHIVDAGKKDDPYARIIAEKMADYDAEYTDLPDRIQRALDYVSRDGSADELVNRGDSGAMPFNQDNHFDGELAEHRPAPSGDTQEGA